MSERHGQAVRRLAGPWSELTLPTLLETSARARPDRIALVDTAPAEAWLDRPAGPVTNAVVAEGLQRAARQLAALGLKPGDTVITLLPNHSEAHVLALGVLRAGLVLCPLPVTLDPALLVTIAHRLRARAIITMVRCGEHRPVDAAVAAARDVMSIRYVCALGLHPPEGVVSLHGWRTDELAPTLPSPPDPLRPALVTLAREDGDTVAYMRTHAQVMADALAVAATAGLTARSRMVSAFAPATAASFAAALAAPLLAGATVELLPLFALTATREALRQEPAAILAMPEALEADLREALADVLGDTIVVRRRLHPVSVAPLAGRTSDVLALGERVQWCRARVSPERRLRVPRRYLHPVTAAIAGGTAFIEGSMSPRGRLVLQGFGVAQRLGAGEHGGDEEAIGRIETPTLATGDGADHLLLSSWDDAAEADADMFERPEAA